MPLGSKIKHNTIRKHTVVFGNIFSGITVDIKNDDKTFDTIEVPINYSSKQKWVQKLYHENSTSDGTIIKDILPRISFLMTGIAPDTERSLPKTKRHVKRVQDEDTSVNFQYHRVPYNYTYNVSILAQRTDDALQIIEQIVPFFDPEFTVTIEEEEDINIKTNVPIVLESITLDDSFDGDFTDRRLIAFDLEFIMKGYLYKDTSNGAIIKKAKANTYTDLEDFLKFNNRGERTTVTPNPINRKWTPDFGEDNEDYIVTYETLIEPEINSSSSSSSGP